MDMLPFRGPPCELTLLTSSLVGDEEERVEKLEDYLKGLEEERFKIEAFKRELPFSMQLLNDVIQSSKAQLEQNLGKPAREKFDPVNRTCEEPLTKKSKVTTSSAKRDVPDWMKSAGLWSHRHETEEDTLPHLDSHPQKTNNLLDYKNRVGGAFLPFSRERQQTSSCSDVGEQGTDSHSSTYKKGLTQNAKKTAEAIDEGNPPNTNTSDGANPNCKRKVRRCWSPELHKKFVNALQQLGGAHATPKHIRELMKVEGLTNDEVKSHLQKYRLHTRRPSPCRPQFCEQSHGAQLMMVGVEGIWIPQAQGHYYCQEASNCIGCEENVYALAPSYSFQQEAQGDPQSSCISIDAWKGDSS